MAKGIKDGCGPWLWSSKHLWRTRRLEHLEAGSGRERRGGSIHVTSCTHKGLTHPAKTPALKVGMGLLHPAPRRREPVMPGLNLCCCKVPVYTPRCPPPPVSPLSLLPWDPWQLRQPQPGHGLLWR